MRYLVTGGFGFMGSWVTDYLIANGHEVFILSRSNNHTFSSQQSFGFIQADIAKNSPKDIASKLPDIDVCIHTAANTQMATDNYGKEALFANSLGTRNLLEALLVKNNSQKKLPVFVYASTFHVYGLSQGEINENTLVAPQNDYALTHFFAEEYCRMYHRVSGIPTVIARCTNGYGEPKCFPFTHWNLLFNDFCCSAIKDHKITLRSPASTVRDFIWMGDVAIFLAKLAESPDIGGEIFNISRGKSCSIGAIAQSIATIATAITGKEVTVSVPDDAGFLSNPLVVSNQKIIATTGHTPNDHIEDAVKTILQNLKDSL